MRELIFLCLIILFFPSCLSAKTAEDDRRIEEEKRESLRPTETITPLKKQPVPEPFDRIDLDYYRELYSKKVAIIQDICKILIALEGLESQIHDIDAQIKYLAENGIFPKTTSGHLAPEQPLRKGLTAYMLSRTLNIKGGVWMRIFGTSQRYALKELVFKEIMSPGNVNDIISGKELILIFTRAIDYTITAKTKVASES